MTEYWSIQLLIFFFKCWKDWKKASSLIKIKKKPSLEGFGSRKITLGRSIRLCQQSSWLWHRQIQQFGLAHSRADSRWIRAGSLKMTERLFLWFWEPSQLKDYPSQSCQKNRKSMVDAVEPARRLIWASSLSWIVGLILENYRSSWLEVNSNWLKGVW